MLPKVEQALQANLLLPEGLKFRPFSAVTRAELSEAIVRSGLVPQYLAAGPIYTDVRDVYSRNSVESVQAGSSGALIYDASAGSRFYPYNAATKLVAAVAFVKAAGLESQAATTMLPLTVTDAASIPAQWRGYVAVALRNGLISLDGNKFNPTKASTRIELADSLVRLVARQ